ncbi:MAG: DUF5362 family protein [Flavobacteriaceae bacterium]
MGKLFGYHRVYFLWVLSPSCLLFGKHYVIFTQLRQPTAAGLGTVGSGMFTFIYLILAGVCFLIYLYLYRFAKKLKVAINSNDSTQLEESFKNLKLYYKINGIIIIVFFGIYVLAALFGIIAALAIS